MKSFEAAKDTLIIRFTGADFRQGLADVRTVPEAKYAPESKFWVCPNTEGNRKALISRGFRDASMKHTREAPFYPPKIRDIHIPTDMLHPDILPFQVRGVQKAEEHDGVFMFLDDQGVGKTWEAMGYLKIHPEFERILISCPAFLKYKWKRELEAWGFSDIYVAAGKKAPSRSELHARIIIVSYNLLHPWISLLETISWNVIVLDEAQFITNEEAQRTAAIIRLMQDTPHRILLSGTLMRGSVDELFVPFSIVSPENFKNHWQYRWRYCDPSFGDHGWEFKGLSNSDELRRRMSPFYIRRMKEEVLPDLPKRMCNIISFEMESGVQRQYDRASEKFEAWATGLDRKEAAGKACYAEQRQLAYLGKRKEVLDWLSNFIQCGRKIAVFAWHTNAIDDLAHIFGDRCVVVDGRVDMEKREVLRQKFIEDDKVQIFIGQIAAAGIGIDLTIASDVVFVEFPWSPLDALQAEDRARRLGNKNEKIQMWYLVAANTVDDDMAELLQTKYKKFDTLFGDGSADPFFGKDYVEYIAERIRKRHEKHHSIS